MSVLTAILVVRITADNPAQVKATITWPLGETETVTLNHDWGADSWDWRGGHMPTSLASYLLVDKMLPLHGARSVYVSPADVGTGTNEQGRVMVYELDYEA